MEAVYILVGLAMLGSWVYTYVFAFQNWKNAPNTFAKVVLVTSAVLVLFFLIDYIYG